MGDTPKKVYRLAPEVLAVRFRQGNNRLTPRPGRTSVQIEGRDGVEAWTTLPTDWLVEVMVEPTVDGSVVLADGNAWQRHGGGWYEVRVDDPESMSWEMGPGKAASIIVLYVPEVAS